MNSIIFTIVFWTIMSAGLQAAPEDSERNSPPELLSPTPPPLVTTKPQDATGSANGAVTRILYNKNRDPDGVIVGKGGACQGQQIHLGPDAARNIAELMRARPDKNLVATGYASPDGCFIDATEVEYDETPIGLDRPRGRTR